MKCHLFLGFSLLSLSLAACSAGAPDASDGAQSAEDPIVGGTTDRAKDPAVVAIDIGGEALCTGSLIGPRLVLTARHCVSQTAEGVDCPAQSPQIEGTRATRGQPQPHALDEQVKRASRCALLALLFGCAVTSRAAALVHRRHFEPDDLELDPPGILDFDFQAGPLHGDSAGKNRLLLPDFEIGLGFSKEVEFDVSGAFSVNENRGESHHVTADPLWLATKLGLLDAKDDDGNIWAGGLELGPRLPILDAGGIGFGALALFGVTRGKVTVVLNTGCLIDPGATRWAEHPTGLVAGLDLNADLDPDGIWSLQGELSTSYYLTPDPHEISFTFGGTYAVTPRLDVSLTALGGVLPDTDHAGLMLGVSPELDLW